MICRFISLEHTHFLPNYVFGASWVIFRVFIMGIRIFIVPVQVYKEICLTVHSNSGLNSDMDYKIVNMDYKIVNVI